MVVSTIVTVVSHYTACGRCCVWS